MQSHGFLCYDSLEKCFSRFLEVNSDSDLNTDQILIQRHILLSASEHNCFPSVVTKQHIPIYSRCSSGKLAVRT